MNSATPNTTTDGTTLQLVIPTLWRPAALVAALEGYLHSPAVERVIVIDNAPALRPAAVRALEPHPRLLLLAQPENLYVNPAWNLGLAQIASGSSLVGILNDDIQIPACVLEGLLAQAPAAGTVVGLLPPPETAAPGPPSPAYPLVLEPFPYRRELSIGSQCRGFGSALFLRRGDFVPIPSSLQIWFGDDWILQRASRVLGLRSAWIRIERHVTMAAMRRSETFRQQLARDQQLAPRLLGWEPPGDAHA